MLGKFLKRVSAAFLFFVIVTAGCGSSGGGGGSKGGSGNAKSPDVVAVSAGFVHTCALTKEGGVKCWGQNDHGQLGDKSTVERHTPVDVCADSACSVSLSGISAVVSGGYEYSCAVTTGKEVKCWGINDVGELGDGSKTDRHTPVSVCSDDTCSAPLSDIRVLTTQGGSMYGHSNTCVAPFNGWAHCWGADYGTTPVDIHTEDFYGVLAISSGEWHTCAIVVGLTVKCWGSNDYGQLGIGSPTNAGKPLNVCADETCATPLSDVVAISSGAFHTCALTKSGGIKCWGYNGSGGLGIDDSTIYQSSYPMDVVGLTSGVKSISAGGMFMSDYTCAITSEGGAKCWGTNYFGELGDGTTTDRFAPVDVKGLTSGVKSISAGGGHTCAITEKGILKCWGWNYNGQLGNNSTTDSNTPVEVKW